MLFTVSYDCDVRVCEERGKTGTCGAQLLLTVVEACGAESVPARARFVPSTLFLACLSPLACGLRAAVWSLQVDETRDTHAYSACGLTNWSSWSRAKAVAFPEGFHVLKVVSSGSCESVLGCFRFLGLLKLFKLFQTVFEMFSMFQIVVFVVLGRSDVFCCGFDVV